MSEGSTMKKILLLSIFVFPLFAQNSSGEFLEKLNEFFITAAETVLGVTLAAQTSSSEGLESSLVELLIVSRNEARKAKQFALSDKIRDDLKSIGILIEDTKEGTTWKKV